MVQFGTSVPNARIDLDPNFELRPRNNANFVLLAPVSENEVDTKLCICFTLIKALHVKVKNQNVDIIYI